MASFYKYVGKAAQNRNNSAVMRFWDTNFNMPVTNILDAGGWQEYVGPNNLWHIDTSFNFAATDGNYSPILYPGREALLFTGLTHWDNTGTGGNTTIYLQARNPSGVSIASYSYNYNVPASSPWAEFSALFNVGVAPWEVSTSGTFYFDMWTTGWDATGTSTTSYSFSNVPTSTQSPGSSYSGSIWVEGTTLCFINANGWKEIIPGVVQSFPGATPGAMWIDTNNNLSWVGNDGNVYIPGNKIQQFYSYFSNGAPGSVYAPGHEGSIWVDNQFGWTHISYIGNNGYKWLTGGGKDPYTAWA